MSQIPLFSTLPRPSWTVTDLTRYLRDLFDSDELLQDVWVQGEVSNLSHPASGHLYFTLKDRNAALRCVMWRSNVSRLTTLPREGEALEVHGAISIYEVSGQYQLYVDLIRPAGEGVLYQQFLQLKARLEAEGLFDPSRKRPIPALPACIGIVTSATGAALRDMLHTLRRRYPLVRVVLAPTAVQGDEAPPSIVAALQALNLQVHPDIILLARGGGSIEDLWAFNDERVARAIAASTAPVICGVGHETDFTIADFVADLRAPTPTAAAELATPDQLDLRAGLAELAERLERAILTALSSQRLSLSTLRSRMDAHSPRLRLQTGRQRLDELIHRLNAGLEYRLKLERTHQAGLTQRLAALNPQAVLERGYAILTGAKGELIRSVRQVSPGDALRVHLSDGEFPARVEGK
jgi:exodeoxyribonuclease VII large subunit